MAFEHETVLLHEAVDGLNVKQNGIYVDCTLGGAGHTSLILHQLQGTGKVIAFDQDVTAIENAKRRLKDVIDTGQLILVHRNFADLKQTLEELEIQHVDGVLYDLGVSSPQFDQGSRGFSYNQEAMLDMRMDSRQSLTAYEIINEWPYEEMVKIFFRYGEEKFSKQVAREIESVRQKGPIETTFDLVEIIKSAIPAPARRRGGHPAKRIFQALRIAVNNELEAVEHSLEQAIDLLNLKGRLSVITFHSLEDRLVKQIIQDESTAEAFPAKLPILPENIKKPILKKITRKPILPTTAEIDVNRRARSAKLRIAEKQSLK
ncbi:16S rRNA (cytosine(1402)-N(4))-methyltransferase RsmH [Allofustis seminis]|uniref:16S rRNA (cytosine(1402)-N(4))-methyltransferase RsmH n=1 Tax=Allofustis seminis TaxID=166939 RepID=UPI00037FBE9B|nr:16S rRNA (cytosine(1402)-N(4))-methyltransferase RsmH [Allofustis seminis]